jgi:hypothetical protein
MAPVLLDVSSRVTFSIRVKTRLLLFILLAISSGSVLAGIYQRTRHTHILVWNDQPTSFQEVTWSGGKDAAGYASGYGTVTWFAPDKPPTTGSSLPSRRKMVVVRSVTGTMEHGKFVDSTNAKNLTAGSGSRERKEKPSPTPSIERIPAPLSPGKSVATPTPTAASSSPATASPRSTPASSPSATETPGSDSINSLTRPPSSLGLRTPAETSPSPEASSSPSPPR